MSTSGETTIYRGWTIEKFEGTHVGYALPGSRSIMARVGAHNHRKIKGYTVHYPPEEGHAGGKFVSTMKEAKKYIDDYLGTP